MARSAAQHMMDRSGRVLILGAGHAGGVVAAQLRQFGYQGPITLAGDEPHLPYQRPPLSKAWLKGEADADSLSLRPAEFYADQRIELLAGCAATLIDRSARLVHFADGSARSYDRLVIATGARARTLELPGAALTGVMALRSASDAEQLKQALGPAVTVAIVGGGYIGLEVAASARALGSRVIVLEREARLLARVARPELSSFFQDYHQQRGVRFELGCSILGFEGEDRVRGVRLADGRLIACDMAVVGVGALPNAEIAAAAGLEVSDGVVVDLEARTSDPDIFAIGDVSQRPMPIYGRMFRMESVPNALEQAKQCAAALTGRPAPAPECPWQWSDQYDLKLQIAGYPFGADEIVVRGEPRSAKFAVFHMKGDQLQAVEAINAPPEFMAGRQLVLSRRPIDRSKLADQSVSMKEVALDYCG